jgi:hypothetical protein
MTISPTISKVKILAIAGLSPHYHALVLNTIADKVTEEEQAKNSIEWPIWQE